MKTRIQSRWISAALLGICLCLPVRAQSLSYFMEVKGPPVPGMAVAEGYENQIEVSSYSLSGANPINLTGGSSGGFVSSGFAFNGLECVMALDGKAYPLLLTHMAMGVEFTEVILSGVTFGQFSESRVFFKLEMKDAKIETVTQQGTNGDQPIVNVLFRPSAMRITTTYVNPNGSPSDPVVFTWNFVTQTPTY